LSFKVTHKRSGKVAVCDSRNWQTCRDHNVQSGWMLYIPVPPSFMETPVSNTFVANKGEHSEVLFALWLVQQGHTLQYRDVSLDYKNDKLRILDSKTGKVLNLMDGNLDDIMYGGIDEILSADGTFASENLAPVYDMLTHHGVNPKAPSQYKSDITIVKKVGFIKRYQSISVKSFLGSNPSILNANKHWSALEYKLDNPTHADINGFKKDKFNITSDQMSRLSFVGYSDPKFKQLVGGFTSFPQLALKWKQGVGNNLSRLTNAITSSTQTTEGKRFIRRVLQGTGKMRPSKIGIVDKSGGMKVHPIDKLWEASYFDAPSRSRHDYGYFYQVNGEWRIRFAVGIRCDARTFDN
jgi:hypothetical protein